MFSPPVTHYSMWLLVSWAHCSSTVKSSLADSEHLHDWLKKLTLLIPEVSPSQPRLFFIFLFFIISRGLKALQSNEMMHVDLP